MTRRHAVQETTHSRRHIIIPDTQIKPGVPLDHLDWAAQACLEYTPDVIVVGGDWWDMPSLNSHSDSEELEGTRYREDIASGNAAFRRFARPIEQEAERQKRRVSGWNPRQEYLEGNHEDRINRAVGEAPKWEGHVSITDCDIRGFRRRKFLQRVWIDGICYSHFFQASHSNRAIGGSVDNRLNKIGASFVAFHEQGFRYGNRVCGSGATMHGLVAGSYYPHIEDYRGAQGQRHWRGIVVLNDVKDGEYDIMPLSMRFLCRKYEGMELVRFMRKKYPWGNWDHLE